MVNVGYLLALHGAFGFGCAVFREDVPKLHHLVTAMPGELREKDMHSPLAQELV